MNSKHIKRAATMPAPPEDVIIEILCRLPVKSLLRFRCVSKQFRSIIDGPDFINRHLQNGHLLNRRRLIVQQGILFPPKLFSMDLDSAGNAFKLEFPFENSGGYVFRVIGSCNGLLALAMCSRISRRISSRISIHPCICLWNISTRKHQILPKFWSDYGINDDVFDGFGYDVATDDYKLVRVIKYANHMIEVIVYSLKANSGRRIENYPPYHNPPYHNYTVHEPGVLVDNALNWVVAVSDIGVCRVMSFDLKGEKFYEVPLPDIRDEVKALSLFVALEGCLCLSCFSPIEVAFEVWVMKEYGVKESWTKLFTLLTESPREHSGRYGFYPRGRYGFYLGIVAFSYSKGNDKVLVYQNDGEVHWRELDKKTYKSVEINEWPKDVKSATIYRDSLVSPKVSI